MTRIGTVGREPMTGTAHPAAIARMVGVLGLRAQEDGAPPVTELRPDGVVVWRLAHGLVVTMQVGDEGRFTSWHLDCDDA
jgi:hypothetical protein